MAPGNVVHMGRADATFVDDESRECVARSLSLFGSLAFEFHDLTKSVTVLF